jgi:hypothetical protein
LRAPQLCQFHLRDWIGIDIATEAGRVGVARLGELAASIPNGFNLFVIVGNAAALDFDRECLRLLLGSSEPFGRGLSAKLPSALKR